MSKIIGNTTATPNPRPDWNQTDANKADYIKNKPTNVSDFQNDVGYLTEHQSLDGLASEDYVKSKIAEIPTPDVSGQINAHNLNTSAHADIREEISQLSSEKVDKDNICLGIASDGLMHIFINGDPVGPGVARGGGDDVFGYVDENNVVVLSSNLPTGAYTIKYEMADGSLIDIGSLVLDNNVYYSITNNLTNCTTNNTALQVVEGESYTATISANSGYELKSVTVTMGGSSVSVTNGVINIASVTGNIVITAVAEEKASEPVTVDIALTDGIRIGSDGTDRDATGFCATEMIDLINIPKPCIINLTKALWCHTASQTSSNVRVYAKKADGTQLVSDTTKTTVGSNYFTVVDNTNGNGTNVTVTVVSNDVDYIRFSGWWGSSSFSDSDTDFAKANTKATLTYTPN